MKLKLAPDEKLLAEKPLFLTSHRLVLETDGEVQVIPLRHLSYAAVVHKNGPRWLAVTAAVMGLAVVVGGLSGVLEEYRDLGTMAAVVGIFVTAVLAVAYIAAASTRLVLCSAGGQIICTGKDAESFQTFLDQIEAARSARCETAGTVTPVDAP